MKTALFLFNPRAGKGNIKAGLSKITDTLTRAGFLVTVYPTQAKGDAYEKILQWGLSYDRIVVAGGDGMLHEALNAIMNLERRVDLAYIPSGTANDFAIANNIPKSVDKAVQVAVADNRRTIDIGSFNGEYFSYVAAFGAITDIPYTTDQAAKNNLGYLAYLLNAAKYMNPQILLGAAREMEIKTDDMILTGEYLVCCVSNSKTIGSLKQFVPKDVELDDGLFEGLFIKKPTNIVEFSNALNVLLLGNLHAPGIITVKSSKFEFSLDKSAEWTLDGEDGGSHDTAVIENHHQALTMLMP
ncbi:MAG: diacylglycerol kinase family lipid kinase [Spirochaetales bacterium]|jgi:YegS/Rv2252/BmrU family lipid kinase|nr:diacylglycerol kinase family lipid kinase [Spirochaetales bacterium]